MGRMRIFLPKDQFSIQSSFVREILIILYYPSKNTAHENMQNKYARGKTEGQKYVYEFILKSA